MAEYLFRDSPATPIEVVATEGSTVIGTKGEKYLDFMMGWCVGNAGWGKEPIQRATASFQGPTYVSPGYQYRRWDDLARRLVSLVPGKKGTCFRTTGGTEAVEVALKISRAYNRREKFIAFKNAYHGQSLACLGLVGLHEQQFGPYPPSIRLTAGDWERTTEAAVAGIEKGDVCAFISEPIICNLGVIVPPLPFFAAVRKACTKTGTVFIMDEVATGFGRTGKWFGFEHFGLTPDVITLAKGLSSGYAPIGATIASTEIAEAMRFDFSNYSTFGWHPLGVEACLASISYLEEHKLVERAERSGRYLMNVLSEFCRPEGKGLCVGFETKNRHLVQDCRERGLLISTINNRVTLFPALDVGRKEIGQAAGILKQVA